MKNRKQIKSIVNQAIKASFKDGQLIEKNAFRFVKLFSAQSSIEAIKLLSEYLKRVKSVSSFTTMVVESVVPLSKKQKNAVKRKFSSKFNITNSQFKINPQILGGLKIRVGDHIYDDSIQTRIYQVKETIRN